MSVRPIDNNRKYSWKTPFVISVVVVGAGSLGFLGLYSSLPRHTTREICAEFERSRERYELLVKMISGYNIPNQGKEITFELSEDRAPGSLKAYDPGRPGAFQVKRAKDTERLVDAWRESDGRLMVKFTIRNDNHGGVWYLVFSNPPSPHEEQRRPEDNIVQIDPHWRVVYDADH